MLYYLILYDRVFKFLNLAILVDLKLCNKEIEFYVGLVGLALFLVTLDLPAVDWDLKNNIQFIKDIIYIVVIITTYYVKYINIYM